MKTRSSYGLFLGVVGTVLLFTWGCGDREVTKPLTRQATPLDLSTVGVIAGHVSFKGPVPAQTPLPLGGDAACVVQHRGPVYAGDVLVKGGRLKNALVYVKEGLGDRVFAVPTTTLQIDQKGCIYLPRVVGLQVGQLLQFLNSDPTLHNVHTLPKRSPQRNFALPVQGSKRTIRFDVAEVVVESRCDVHPWMKAYIGVLDHPYFSLSGEDGTFELKNLPPGEYLVEAWHERFGTRTQQVSVAPREVKRVSFAFEAPPPTQKGG